MPSSAVTVITLAHSAKLTSDPGWIDTLAPDWLAVAVTGALFLLTHGQPQQHSFLFPIEWLFVFRGKVPTTVPWRKFRIAVIAGHRQSRDRSPMAHRNVMLCSGICKGLDLANILGLLSDQFQQFPVRAVWSAESLEEMDHSGLVFLLQT